METMETTYNVADLKSLREHYDGRVISTVEYAGNHDRALIPLGVLAEMYEVYKILNILAECDTNAHNQLYELKSRELLEIYTEWAKQGL